jgi:hypothetical protein
VAGCRCKLCNYNITASFSPVRGDKRRAGVLSSRLDVRRSPEQRRLIEMRAALQSNGAGAQRGLGAVAETPF